MPRQTGAGDRAGRFAWLGHETGYNDGHRLLCNRCHPVTGATHGTQTAKIFAYDTNGNRTSVAPASGGGSAVIGAYNRVTDDGAFTHQYGTNLSGFRSVPPKE
ncbi:MAG: hypothetical protein ACK50J_26520 [Planctomyces sp.]